MTTRFQALMPALIPALAAAAALAWQVPAFADPPGWAPAYGERGHDGGDDNDQSDHRRDEHRDDRRDDYRDDRPREAYPHGFHGYRGDDWDNDYGVVRSGRCDTDAVLGVVGAVTGGLIGISAAAPQDRGIATIFGALAGGLIGHAIGDAIDEGDRACIGQSLELTRVGQPVIWRNPRSQVAWRVEPLRDVSSDCREFDLRRDYRGRSGHQRVVACRRGRGDWAFRGR